VPRHGGVARRAQWRGAGLGLPAVSAPRGRSGLRGQGQPAGLSRAARCGAPLGPEGRPRSLRGVPGDERRRSRLLLSSWARVAGWLWSSPHSAAPGPNRNSPSSAPSRKVNRSRSWRSWTRLYAGLPTKSSREAPRRPGSRASQPARSVLADGERVNPHLSQTLTVAALALPGPSLSLRPRRRQLKAAVSAWGLSRGCGVPPRWCRENPAACRVGSRVVEH
jgi:hypothetical protein